MNHLSRARAVFDIELQALKAVRAQLDDSFAVAVEIVVESLKQRGKIIVVGVGKSGDLGLVNDGDVVLALSYSGASEELLNLFPALKRFSVKIIAFTGAPKSPLA